MAITITIQHPLAFAFGSLGNIVSFMVFLAPVPTFYRIYKRKSTEEFQSIPYVIALFSAMLWLYYAFISTTGYMLIAINSLGTVIETTYLVIYLVYAHKKARIFTMELLLILNIGVYGLIVLVTFLLVKGSQRVTVVGWIGSTFALIVFIAPLSIMRKVIRTKSVEYMPFGLSLTLTLCAIMWFFYGYLMKDIYIAIPNILGFAFGIAQMVLYIIYKDKSKDSSSNMKMEEMANTNKDSKLGASENLIENKDMIV